MMGMPQDFNAMSFPNILSFDGQITPELSNEFLAQMQALQEIGIQLPPLEELAGTLAGAHHLPMLQQASSSTQASTPPKKRSKKSQQQQQQQKAADDAEIAHELLKLAKETGEMPDFANGLMDSSALAVAVASSQPPKKPRKPRARKVQPQPPATPPMKKLDGDD
jgi:hypothetical protein